MKISIRRDEDTNRVDFTVNGQEYHTNKSGEGIWVGGDYMKQIAGTCDFNLKQTTYSGMYKAIRKHFGE